MDDPSLTRHADAPRPASRSGTPDRAAAVWFVGAGPGHPDLITVAGRNLLARADCVVHDRLVPEAVLALAPPSARRINAPRDSSDADPGTATGRMLVDLARSGGLVVRLKGGDPGLFARLAEEQGPLLEAGIPFATVPGVSALFAAAAAAGIPLTDRGCASHVTIVTAHEAAAKPHTLDFRALAAFPGTLGVYMGVGSAARWARGLLAAGRPSTEAVTMVSRCAWPDQRVVRTTLGDLAEAGNGERWPAPAVAILGAVSAAGAGGPPGPLAGRTVLVTRPAGQAADAAAAIEALGGRCLHVPVVRIGPPDSWSALDGAISRADTFDWIVFASVNGVRGFVDRLRASRRDARALGTARLAAIGPATARALEDSGLVCDLEPARRDSEGMVEALSPTMRRGRVLLVRGDRGRDAMRRGLEAAGHEVEEVAAYATRPVEALPPADRAAIDSAVVDWITVTSGMIAEAAVTLFGERMRGWRVASISPVTSSVLKSLGFEAECEATTPSSAALVAAIEGRERARPSRSAPGSGLPAG